MPIKNLVNEKKCASGTNSVHKAFVCIRLNSRVYHRERLIDAHASRSLREKVGRERKAEVAQR